MAEAAEWLGAGPRAVGGHRSRRPHLGAAPATHRAGEPASASGTAGARVRCRRRVPARLGRPRCRIRLARQRARHLRGLSRERLDRRQQPHVPVVDPAVRRHAAEVHERRQVPVAAGRTRQERRQQGHAEREQGRRRLRLPEDQRAVRGRRLRQPSRDRVRRRHRGLQAHVGGVRQRADRRARHAGATARPGASRRPGRAGTARYRGPGVAAIRRTRARREGGQRRPGLCGRSPEPARAGVRARRQVHQAGVRESRRPVERFGGRHRVFARRRAAVHVPRRLRQLARGGDGPQEPADPLSVRHAQRRTRTLPGPAPPGRGLERQSVRGGSRARQSRAAIRVPWHVRRGASRGLDRGTAGTGCGGRGAGAGRRRSGARVPAAGTSARRLSAVDEHDGQPVPGHAQLAAARRHQARCGNRHHPGRQGRDVAAPPLGAANPAHRRVGRRRSPLRQRNVRAGTRLLPGPGRQLLGRRQRTRSRTIRPPRAAASSCSSSVPTARCC